MDIFCLTEENGKTVDSVYSVTFWLPFTQAGGLEIPLLNSKSTHCITHKKLKVFITLILYSYEYKSEDKNPDKGDDYVVKEINFVIEDDDEVEKSELIRPKMKWKPPAIDNDDELENTEPDESRKLRENVECWIWNYRRKMIHIRERSYHSCVLNSHPMVPAFCMSVISVNIYS